MKSRFLCKVRVRENDEIIHKKGSEGFVSIYGYLDASKSYQVQDMKA